MGWEDTGLKMAGGKTGCLLLGNICLRGTGEELTICKIFDLSNTLVVA